MRFILVAVGLGAAIGVARTGRARHAADRPVRLWGLLVAGVVLQAAAGRADSGLALVLVAYALLVGFALANLATVGMWLVAIGVALNMVVIAANDGMPVRPAALVDAGLAGPREVALELTGPRRHEVPGDRLTGLADILPVRPLREVLSFGDLVMAVGVADVLAHLLRRRARRRAAPPRLWHPVPAEP